MKRKGPITRLKEEFEEKNKELKELKDKYLRAIADMDNYRKLMQKEMDSFRRSNKIRFFNKIIPVLDSFDRALNGAEVDSDDNKFFKGMEIVHRQLKESLKSLGLVEFSGLGEVFDPTRHEAVSIVVTDDQPENMVVDEISKGYVVDKQVIKPAKVLVSRHKEGGQENGENNRD